MVLMVYATSKGPRSNCLLADMKQIDQTLGNQTSSSTRWFFFIFFWSGFYGPFKNIHLYRADRSSKVSVNNFFQTKEKEKLINPNTKTSIQLITMLVFSVLQKLWSYDAVWIWNFLKAEALFFCLFFFQKFIHVLKGEKAIESIFLFVIEFLEKYICLLWQ